MASRLLTAVLAVSLGTGVFASRQATNAWPDFLAFYRQALTQHAIVGSSVAWVENGHMVQRAHEGMRDQKTGAKVDDNTIFHWASITKTFTGIAIMRLRDEGRLTLEDPIVKYVPEFRKVHNPFGRLSRSQSAICSHIPPASAAARGRGAARSGTRSSRRDGSNWSA